MRFKVLLLIILAAMILICGTATGESLRTDSISCEEWDWSNESVNVFTGSIDLFQWTGTEITLEMKAVFEPAGSSANDSVPKFTHLNGKRLPMKEQSNTAVCTPNEGNTAVSFNGSLQIPEKGHYQKVSISLKAKGADGKELKSISAQVMSGGSAASRAGNVFYIPFEIRTVAWIIAAAAAAVWCLAVARNRLLSRKRT